MKTRLPEQGNTVKRFAIKSSAVSLLVLDSTLSRIQGQQQQSDLASKFMTLQYKCVFITVILSIYDLLLWI